MKLITSAKKFVVYSLLLLITVCSFLLTPPTALAASVDFGTTQYLAFDTTTQPQTTAEIDAKIAAYRKDKLAVSKDDSLSLDSRKAALKGINDEINALVKQKKELSPAAK